MFIALSTFLLVSTRALLITGPERPSLFLHIRAQFGPSDYDVQAPLVGAVPADLCSMSTMDLSDRVVLIERGHCTFVEKVLAAQRAGAVAVVVGNTASDDPSPVTMAAAPGSDADAVVIPSVFVSLEVNQWLWTALNHSQQEQRQLLAAVNKLGEVSFPPIQPPFSNPLKMAFVLLLFLPMLWCAVFAIVTFRRLCILRRTQALRVSRTRTIPLVIFRHSEANESGGRRVPSPNQPHNDTCAICLEDFSEGLEVKLLPCMHGFHPDCVDPWLNARSELCPICKTSILDSHPTQSRFLQCCPARMFYQPLSL
jgi:hypothetical protein